MNISTPEQVLTGIQNALVSLKDEDGMLFQMHIGATSTYYSRKLHEVCINHKLAEKLTNNLLGLFTDCSKLYIDIEFNREGTRPKYAIIKHVKKLARPDIILHNRKTGANKNNILIVECKKRGTTKRQRQCIKDDIGKIRGFMTDPRYAYIYGLQVIYSPKSITGTFFYHLQGTIAEKPINIC